MCRSRRELSNAYLLAKIGVDTAENGFLEVWGENSIQYSLHSLIWIATCAPVAASADEVLQAAAILMTDVASVCKAAKILGWPNSQTGGSTFRLR